MGLESSVTHSVDHNNGLYQIQYWCLLLKNIQVMAPLSEWRRYKQNQINDTKADCTEAVECIMIVNQGKQKHFEQSTEQKINKITTQKSNRKRKEDKVQKKDQAYVHIVTTFTSDSTMDNGSVHTFPALRV